MSAIFSPTAAEHFERQETPAALQHPSSPTTPEQAGAMRPPGPVALPVAAHRAAAGPCPVPARPWPLGVARRSVSLPGRGAAIVAARLDRLVSAARGPGPRSPGKPRAGPAPHRTGGREAAGGPRGGNQDHIQRESRLNFQPRVCRGAWSCLVNAAGNTWDTLTALIVPTHSAVDEL